jgi:hypothetical protein
MEIASPVGFQARLERITTKTRELLRERVGDQIKSRQDWSRGVRGGDTGGETAHQAPTLEVRG